MFITNFSHSVGFLIYAGAWAGGDGDEGWGGGGEYEQDQGQQIN